MLRSAAAAADLQPVSSFTQHRDRAVDALGGLVVVGGLLAWAAELLVAGGLLAAGLVLAVGCGHGWGWVLVPAGGAWATAVLAGVIRPGWWCPAFW